MSMMKAQTKNGTVTGVAYDGGTVFRGIPYAAPPVGKLRFAAPKPAKSWEGERSCDSWPADAWRYPFPHNHSKSSADGEHTYSEDCLYLNIWTPARQAGEKLPVMFWLYGGGGSSHDTHIDGAGFTKRGCILVSINYRMGIFGFFGLKELADQDSYGSTGAYGIQDIVFALQWVRDNIEAFGGDPGNVTVFGHSAGAMFTKLLIGCKPARGLFQHAISLSGGGTWDIDYIHTKESKCRLCQELLDRAGWTLEDMMSRNSAEIYEVLQREEKNLDLPHKSMFNTLFLPSMDDWLIKDYYGKILYDGDVDETVDVMCGMLIEEWHNFPCQIPGGIGDYKREFAMASVIAWGRRYVERGIKPVYTYFFERRMPEDGHWMRHGEELPYVFGTMNRYDKPWTDYDYLMSETTMDYWTSFAKTGNPNTPGRPEWNPYTVQQPVTMHFRDEDIICEDISGYEKMDEVVSYLLAHPGMLDDPFPGAVGDCEGPAF